MTRAQKALVALALLGVALVLGSIAPLKGYEGDIDHYKYWMILITRQGIEAAYSGDFPHTYAIYPPVFLYFLKAVGTGYQVLVDRTLAVPAALADNRLSLAIKAPGILFHLGLMLALMLMQQREHGYRRAYLTGLLYGLNPAAIFAVAYWGHPDSLHTFFIVLGVRALMAKQALAGGALISLGAWTKPQAWPLLPLAVALTWRQTQGSGLLKAGASALAVSALLSFPFWAHGTLGQLAGLPGHIASAMPVTSANASNLWWLVASSRRLESVPPWLPDSDPWLGGLSYATWGYLLVGALTLFSLWTLFRLRQREGVPELFALMAFGFTVLATKVHENHSFQVLALIAASGPLRRSRLALYLGVSATLLLNMALFSPDISEALTMLVGRQRVLATSVANALVNLTILAIWLLLFYRRARGEQRPGQPPQPRDSAQTSGERAP